MLIVLVNLLFILKFAPFVDDADDYLSFVTSCQMFLTLLGGLLIMTDDSAEPTYDANTMGITMVAVNGFGFVALMFSLMALHPMCRKKLNGKKKMKKMKKKILASDGGSGNRNTTKVVPAESMDNEIRNWDTKAK